MAAGLVSVSAAAQDSPVFAWGKTFDGATTAGDQSTAIATGTDGSVYWYNTLGTSGSALDLTFGSQYLFTGAQYSGTSNNSNFSLTKTDADGNLLWAIGSDSGDFANQQGNIAVCPDGSVVFTAKVRHTDGMLQSPISFIDANGRKVAVGQGVEGSRYYFLLIGKVSSDGEILWVHTAEPSRSVIVGDAETALSDIVTVSGTVIDENGHIYIGGSFGHTLTFSSGADTASLTATNTQNWDGKANVCDLFVACFDADGNYIKGMNNTGNPAGNMKVLSMEAEGSMIYFHGVATPVEGCAD
ncbi:MAG: hypothetical protein K2F63_06215, partial [Muribaculaceae bacterium]|nr:hypothetical protein [Muribaculaceae bacterium]